MMPMMPTPHSPVQLTRHVLTGALVLAIAVVGLALLLTPASAHDADECPPPPVCPPEGMVLVPVPPAPGEGDPAQKALEALERAEQALGK